MSLDPDLQSSIERWFAEDIGEGDHTTFSTIPESAKGKARLILKQKGILAGVNVARKIFQQFDPAISIETFIADGTRISPGDIPFIVSGSVHTILQCERLVLNIMQRMSGIATHTREYVDLIKDTEAQVLDTRKTTPGLRILEKEAVHIGGGMNHRIGLYDMILIKDNHIDFSGSIEKAIRNAKSYLKNKGLVMKIEVEVRSMDDIERVLHEGGIDRILLDNFSPEQTRKAVDLIDHRFETESSGGITKQNIRAYANCGVDFISVGALTHQIMSLDMSLKADF